jgi:hypothetical protein
MKAQASVEFMFMIMFATVMIVIFMFLFSEMYQDGLKDKQDALFSDFGASIQRELLIAAYAKEGYTRVLDLPEDLEGYDYDISASNQTLVLNGTYATKTFIVPGSSGQLVKGENTIRIANGSICINC